MSAIARIGLRTPASVMPLIPFETLAAIREVRACMFWSHRGTPQSSPQDSILSSKEPNSALSIGKPPPLPRRFNWSELAWITLPELLSVSALPGAYTANMGLADRIAEKLSSRRRNSKPLRQDDTAYLRAKVIESRHGSRAAILSEFGIAPRPRDLPPPGSPKKVPKPFYDPRERRVRKARAKHRTSGRAPWLIPSTFKGDRTGPLKRWCSSPDGTDEDQPEETSSSRTTEADAHATVGSTQAEDFQAELETKIRDAIVEPSENLLAGSGVRVGVHQLPIVNRDAQPSYIQQSTNVHQDEDRGSTKKKHELASTSRLDAKKPQCVRRPLQERSQGDLNARTRVGSSRPVKTKDLGSPNQISLLSTDSNSIPVREYHRCKPNTPSKVRSNKSAVSKYHDPTRAVATLLPSASLEATSVSNGSRAPEKRVVRQDANNAATVPATTTRSPKQLQDQAGAGLSPDAYSSLSSGAKQMLLNIITVTGLIKGWSNTASHLTNDAFADDETYSFSGHQTQTAAQFLGSRTARQMVEYLVCDPESAAARIDDFRRVNITVEKGLRRGRQLWNLCSDTKFPKAQNNHTLPSALIVEAVKYSRNNEKTTKNRMGKLPKVKSGNSELWKHLIDISSNRSTLFLLVLLCAPKLDFLQVVNHNTQVLHYDDFWYNMVVRQCLEAYSKASSARLDAVEMWFKEIKNKFD
ncbi:hypothetical protein P171DRAFT_487098 [Karstenula rhodostoma CBS 690.94]|uniref:Uncharacterized protein n=1 Tax=Karstenula rhodostoma CBS 690.94 TaxID=1392251 RepID=A0A9P4PFN0_9PLEO|nr:hypothetical protein P171DRAFT_487098 [Karstenula rhodostoma CBS 690.94]